MRATAASRRQQRLSSAAAAAVSSSIVAADSRDSFVPSKEPLLPPIAASSSSVVSAWQRHRSDEEEEEDARMAQHSDGSGGSATSSPAGSGKAVELSDAVTLLPPRRSNDPKYRLPDRTQSSAVYQQEQPSSSNESFISSSQPLPDSMMPQQQQQRRAPHAAGRSSRAPRLLPSVTETTGVEVAEEGQADSSGSPASSAVSSFPTTAHAAHAAAADADSAARILEHGAASAAAAAASLADSLPAGSAVAMGATAASASASSSFSFSPLPSNPSAASRPSSPSPPRDLHTPAASPFPSASSLSIGSPSSSSLPGALQSLASLSPAVYQLSQYHLLLGLSSMQHADFAAAIAAFQRAEAAFRPADDVFPPSAFASQRADLLALRARAEAERAFALEARCRGDGREEQEEARRGVEEAKRLYAAAVAAENGKRGELWNELCLLLMRAGQVEAAGSLYSLLLASFPDCTDLLVNLSVLHSVYGSAEKSVGYLQQALSRHPSHVAALIAYATCLASCRMEAAAIRLLNLALHYHPAHPVALNNLAVLYSATAQPHLALLCLDRAEQAADAHAAVGAALGLNVAAELTRLAREEADTEVWKRELEGAESLIVRELEKETDGKESQAAQLLHLALGGVYTERWKRGAAATDWRRAESEFLRATAAGGEAEAAAWNELGLLYSDADRQHEESKAKAVFQRVLTQHLAASPASRSVAAVPALNNFALLLIRQQQHQQAIALLTIAKSALLPLVPAASAPPSASPPASPAAAASASSAPLSPHLPLLVSVLVNLARAYFLSSQLESARSCYQQAVTLSPSSLSALCGLSCVLAEMGRLDEAERRLMEADGVEGAQLYRLELGHNRRLLHQRAAAAARAAALSSSSTTT